MIWNTDTIDLFKALYLADTPVMQMADTFGLSKRYVYMKASELGISRGYKPIIKTKPLVVKYEPKIRVKSLLDLRHDQCRFVVGDVKVDYGFCGRKLRKGSY